MNSSNARGASTQSLNTFAANCKRDKSPASSKKRVDHQRESSNKRADRTIRKSAIEEIAQFANRWQKKKKNETKTNVCKRAAQKTTRSAESRIQRAAQVR